MLLLLFCLLYLVILLPFSKQSAAIGGAIGAVIGLLGLILGVGASKR